jgi:hypothetical protein
MSTTTSTSCLPGKVRKKSIKSEKSINASKNKSIKKDKSTDIPKKKRVRKDRKEKLERRRTHEERVVKSTLRRYVLGSNDIKDQVVGAIKDRVRAYSKRIVFASRKLLGFVRHSFHHRHVNDVDISNIFTQTFIYQLLVGLENADQPDALLEAYLEVMHDTVTATLPRYQGDWNIYAAGAMTYLTNLKNSLKTTFSQRLKGYLKAVQAELGLSKDDYIDMFFAAQGWSRTHHDTVFTFQMHEIVETIKSILGLNPGASITPRWISLKDNLMKMLRLNVHILRYYESNQGKENLQEKCKLFNLVPLSTIKLHYVAIDNKVFYGICRQLNFLTSLTKKEFDKVVQDKWYSVFNIKKLAKTFLTTNEQGVVVKDKRRFTGLINTDGVSMCMHFERPRNIQDEATNQRAVVSNVRSVADYDVMAACDPGRNNIMYVVTKDNNEEVRSYKLTRNHYYNDSGIFKARKKTNIWNSQPMIKETLNQLSTCSSKGCSWEGYLAFWNTFLACQDVMFGEYTKERWARQRFNLYGGKQRTFARFFNAIQNDHPNQRIVMAYGSAKFAPGSQNEVSVPTSTAFKKCSFRFPTFAIDEFRTTVTDYWTDTILQKVRKRGSLYPLRGLSWCVPSESFVSRDFNAAMNILKCAEQVERPSALTRNGDPPVVQSVVKIIKRRNMRPNFPTARSCYVGSVAG